MFEVAVRFVAGPSLPDVTTRKSLLMRFFSSTLIALVVVMTTASNARAATSSLVIKADVVDYYSNRFILTADGNVRARMSDGTVVTGRTFAMDLKLNRFVIAGNVHLDGPTVHEVGAAFAGFPDLDRSYFLTEGDVPDRWTYFGSNYADRHAGRDQPGDAFYLPDLGGAPPYLVGDSVTVFPKNNIEFGIGSRIRIAGVYTPTPGWVVNFSSNSNFYQNAFSGAVFDIAIPFAGSANAISAAHVRYDTYRGAYLSFDQHYVHGTDYVVFSINPLTQDERQWNLIGYKRESPALETRVFAQLSTLSTWPIKEPSESSSFVNLSINSKVGRYALGINADQYNNSLLPTDDSTFAGALRIDGHPFDVQISLQSFEDEWRLFRYLGVPLKFQYRGGYGWNYDGYGIVAANGLPTWNGALYPLISNTFVGATVYTSSIRVAKLTTLSLKADKQRQWFSLPHHIDTTTFTSTIAYTPTTTKKPAFFLSYNVLNFGDYYGADQLIAYAPYANEVTDQYGTFTGLAAFRGLATSHSLTGSMVYTPTQYFALNLTMQSFRVTPAPVPGLGGQAPYQLNADARFRLTSNLLVDLSRSYYFNFGSQRWSPQFGITLSP
jgi:hypothetical protein